MIKNFNKILLFSKFFYYSSLNLVGSTISEFVVQLSNTEFTASGLSSDVFGT